MTPKAASGGTQRKTHFYLGDDFYDLNPSAGTPILRGLDCPNDSLSLETGNAQFCLWIRPPRVTAGHFVFVRDRNIWAVRVDARNQGELFTNSSTPALRSRQECVGGASAIVSCHSQKNAESSPFLVETLHGS